MIAARQDFGHPPATPTFWRRLAGRALRRGAATPFYLFSAEPVGDALTELEALDLGRPVRHWLSCKTQPVAPLLRWWRRQGRPIEIVSEFEFRAARREGFTADQMLVNGPTKHRWLPRVAEAGLRVNFDSPAELAALLPLARRLHWRVGVRLCTREEFDPEHPDQPTQFGFVAAEAVAALKRLRRAKAPVEMIHFHLRTNVASPDVYERALNEAADVCRATDVAPRFLDCGGGLPPPHTCSLSGKAFDAGMDLRKFAATFRRSLRQFPSVEELWLENGRFLTARSGALVVRVLDVKERRGGRQLICDGGRTLHALVSNWEQHALIPLEARRGRRVSTAVHGPTCMAFDQLGRLSLPASLRAGDHLLWLEAGAYHIPWETRFSHGLAEVWWHERDQLTLARAAESFEQFWGTWR